MSTQVSAPPLSPSAMPPVEKDAPRCTHCTHAMAWHDERGCMYGRGNVHGGCACARDHKGKPIAKKRIDESTHETLFAKALRDAARAAHAMGDALSMAANEAGLARAEAATLITRPMPMILKAPSMEAPKTVDDVRESMSTTPPPSYAAALATATLGDGPRKVLAVAALYEGGATGKQIVARCGLSESSVRRYALDLRTAGLLEADRYEPTPAGRTFLVENRVDFKPKDLDESMRALLRAMTIHPEGATGRRLALHTGLSESSIRRYALELRNLALCEPGSYRPTTEGASLVEAEKDRVLVGRALVDFWIARLGSGEADVFRQVLKASGEPVPIATLADNTGLSESSIRRYLLELRAKNLVTDGTPSLAPELVEELTDKGSRR